MVEVTKCYLTIQTYRTQWGPFSLLYNDFGRRGYCVRSIHVHDVSAKVAKTRSVFRHF